MQDNILQSETLTPDQRDEVIQALQENLEKNENLKVLSELPSNNGIEEHEPEDGEEKIAMVNINPFTGEKTVDPFKEVEESDDLTLDDTLMDLGNVLNGDNIGAQEEYKFDIEPDDVKKVSREGETTIGNYSISDKTAIELLDVINRKRSGQEIKFKDMPEEIKQYINKFCSNHGISGYSNQANFIRNELADSLMSEYIAQISLAKIHDDFNKEVENVYDKSIEEMSPIFKEYNEHREEYLAKLTEKIEDEEKKKVAESVLDSIHDAYELNRIKTLDHAIKIKKYYMEEPGKIYSKFQYRYNDSKYQIYELSMVEAILNRHLKKNNLIAEDDDTTAKKIMITFALFCQNYDLSKPEDHAFMYYFTYNIALLDIYKNDNYDEFAGTFLNNVMGILNAAR